MSDDNRLQSTVIDGADYVALNEGRRAHWRIDEEGMTINRNCSARRLVVTMPLVDVEFTSHSSTGTDDQTLPGMNMTAFVHTQFEAGIRRGENLVQVPLGVIPRADLRRLIAFMKEFLVECEGYE